MGEEITLELNDFFRSIQSTIRMARAFACAPSLSRNDYALDKMLAHLEEAQLWSLRVIDSENAKIAGA